MPPCPACASPTPPDARFCPTCGAALDTEAPAEERKLVTVLFADVTGSTGLGDRLDPERLRLLLSRYFTAMSAVIESWGGTIEKYIGDAIMAVFGVPQAREDDAERALRAALEMRERLDQLNVGLEALHGVRLAARIGINTGEVIAPLDARSAAQRIITGDAVNVAARLEQEAPPGDILVGERTHTATRHAFRFTDPIAVQVRGKPQPGVAYALIGLRAAPGEAPRLQATMVGRDRELAVLEGLLDEVADAQRPRLAVIFGPAGIGKSRLVAEFIAGMGSRAPTIRVLRGRCLSAGHATTFWPLGEILRSAAGITLDDPGDDAWRKLEACARANLDHAGDEAEALARAIHALGATAGHAVSDGPLAGLEPQGVAEEMARAWARFATGYTAEGPAIWVVEDLHWAADELLVLLERLIARAAGPLLLVATARPEFAARRPALLAGQESTSTISLQPLTQRQGAELVDRLVSTAELPGALRDDILAKAEGNPFFLEELLQQLIDRGDLAFAGGRWHTRADTAHVALPDTIHALLAARIDALPTNEKRVLYEAAVIGRTFWSAPLRTALPGADVGSALLSLERRGLVRERAASALSGHDEFLFKHSLVREVAYGAVPKARRARAHADVAEWLEGLSASRADELAQLVAYHYRQALTDPDADLAWADDAVGRARVRRSAFGSLLETGNAARERYSQACFELHETALAIAADDDERADAQEALGDDHRAFYRGDAALPPYMASLEIRRGQHRRAEVARIASKLGLMAQRFGSFKRLPPAEAMQAVVDEGLEAVDESTDPATRARLLTFYANMSRIWIGSRMGRLLGHDQEDPIPMARRRGAAEEALELARSRGLVDETAQALDALAELALLEGDWPRYRRALTQQLALVDQIGSPSERADVLFENSRAKAEAGDYDEATRLARRGLEIAEALSPHEWMHASYSFSVAAWILGRWDEIIALTPQHLELAAGEPDVSCSAVRSAGLLAARILVERNDADEAARIAPLPERMPERIASAHAAQLAEYALAAGRHDLVRDIIDRMLTTSRALLAEGIGTTVDALVALEEWDRLASLLPTAREIAAGIAILGALCDRAEGQMLAARGENAEAAKLLRRAIGRLDALQAPFEAARTREALATLGPDDARELIEEARERYASLGARRRLEGASSPMAGRREA